MRDGNYFYGDLKKLWKELDADGGGFIEFAELAPEDAAIMEAFRTALVAEADCRAECAEVPRCRI